MNNSNNSNNSIIFIPYYYLLYKLNTSNIMWIVKISDNFSSLKSIIKNYTSNDEKYYIVYKLSNDINLKPKNFTKFTFDENCITIYQTSK